MRWPFYVFKFTLRVSLFQDETRSQVLGASSLIAPLYPPYTPYTHPKFINVGIREQ